MNRLSVTRHIAIVSSVISAGIMCLPVGHAFAHASGQSFVLLLPTGIYIASGVAAVALTAVALGLIPDRVTMRFFTGKAVGRLPIIRIETVTSLLSFGLLALLVYTGIHGVHDPLENPLPLFIWTVWWIGFVTLQAAFGDLWHWVNPWSGLYRLLGGAATGGPLRLPSAFGAWPGIVAFLAFASFLLADPAPDDPSRLAFFVGLYWLFTFICMGLFGGEEWLSRGECFTILLRNFASLSPLRAKNGKLRIGLPAWKVARAPALTASGAVFVIFMLGTGSFDGLNETFWWLANIGINPLEFPGRSAIVLQTVAGLVAANLLLVSIYAAAIFAGLKLAGETGRFWVAFGRFARAILPIALGYHVAHYLIAFLVNGQYALAVANDPLATGATYLGLNNFEVTTGFLKSRDPVRIIWLAQAGAVVAGHMLAVMVSHAIAIAMFRDRRKALVSQFPLAVFMVLYTLFGLWLLASPRAG